MDRIDLPTPISKFALKCGIKADTLYKIRDRKQSINDDQAARIHWATRGKIPIWVLLPDGPWKKGQVPKNPFKPANPGDTAPEAA